ncbi:hypothetical protein ACOME3_001172 [Neoechinorhynchus agilis]
MTTKDECRRARFHSVRPWIAYSCTQGSYVEDLKGNILLLRDEPCNDFCFLNEYIDETIGLPLFLSVECAVKDRCDMFVYALNDNGTLEQCSGFSLIVEDLGENAVVDYGQTNCRLLVSTSTSSKRRRFFLQPLKTTVSYFTIIYTRLAHSEDVFVYMISANVSLDQFDLGLLRIGFPFEHSNVSDNELEAIHAVDDLGSVSMCMRNGRSLQVSPFTKPPVCPAVFQSSSKSLLGFSNRLEIVSLEGRAVRLAATVETNLIGGFVSEASKKWREKSPSTLIGGQQNRYPSVTGLYAHQVLPIVGIVADGGCLSVYGNIERIGVS